MSDRGGKREGAGRKKGSLGKKTREIAERAVQEGITPLEVMLETMRDAWAAGERDKAISAAKDAAPYVHPKLAPTDPNTGKTYKFILIDPTA
jgi:hypothetical protein